MDIRKFLDELDSLPGGWSVDYIKDGGDKWSADLPAVPAYIENGRAVALGEDGQFAAAEGPFDGPRAAFDALVDEVEKVEEATKSFRDAIGDDPTRPRALLDYSDRFEKDVAPGDIVEGDVVVRDDGKGEFFGVIDSTERQYGLRSNSEVESYGARIYRRDRIPHDVVAEWAEQADFETEQVAWDDLEDGELLLGACSKRPAIKLGERVCYLDDDSAPSASLFPSFGGDYDRVTNVDEVVFGEGRNQ